MSSDGACDVASKSQRSQWNCGAMETVGRLCCALKKCVAGDEQDKSCEEFLGDYCIVWVPYNESSSSGHSDLDFDGVWVL